jgi:two-component system, NtrC family, sensor kinase
VRARYYALFGLVVIGLLPLAIAGALMMSRAEKTSLGQATLSNQRVAEGVARRLAAFEQSRMELLGTLADALNPNAHLTPQQAAWIIKGYQISFRHLRSIDVVGAGSDCMEIATSRLDGKLRPRCGETSVDEALAGRFYRGPVRLEQSSPVMAMGVPLSLAGEKVGAVVADVDMVGIWDVVNEVKVGRLGRARLLSGDGTLLAHGDPTQRGQVFAPYKDPALEPLRTSARGAGYRYDSGGRDVLAVAATVPGAGWTVIVEQPVEEAFDAAASMRSALWRVVLVSIVVMGLVGFLVLRGPVGTLEAMRQHAVRIGHGELDARLPEPRVRELRDLARQLNLMASELGTLQDEIRRRERLSTFAQVAAGLAHDLQKPIERTRDACHYVLTSPDDPNAMEALRRSWDGDLARLARYVLDLRRLAHEKDLSLVPTSVEPRPLADRLIADVTASPRWMDVKFEVKGEAEAVWADEDLVVRALGNLIHNACDACLGRDPSQVTVEIGDEENGQIVYFAVRDTGQGVKPERLDEILSGTFKSDKHTTGIGLGLAVARGVARAHGGSLEATSRVGQGSEFRLRLRRLHVGDLAARDVGRDLTGHVEEKRHANDGRDHRGAA